MKGLLEDSVRIVLEHRIEEAESTLVLTPDLCYFEIELDPLIESSGVLGYMVQLNLEF